MTTKVWNVIATLLVAYLFLAPWLAIGAFVLGMPFWGVVHLIGWVALIAYIIHRAS